MTDPNRTEATTMLEFGGAENDDANASLSAVFRQVADWLDENEDAYVEDAVVHYADEFDTWWISLYVDSVREEMRVTAKWKRDKTESRVHMEAIRREVEAQLAAEREASRR